MKIMVVVFKMGGKGVCAGTRVREASTNQQITAAFSSQK